MPLQVKDVDFADGDSIAEVYIAAFFNDAFQQTLYPGMSYEAQVSGVKLRWARNYGDPSAHYKKVIDTETGDLISYSKWSFVNTTAGGELRRPQLPEGVTFPPGPPATPEGLNDDFAVDFTNRVTEIKDRKLGREYPHLCLKMLGTHPSHQHRGAGDLQLRWATETADHHGLACWVDASPVSVRLYQKHGFVIKGEVVVNLHESAGGGKYTYTSMLHIRNPYYVFTWVRPGCYDEALAADFRQRYGFWYYEDDQGRVEVLYETVQLGERDLYSSWEQRLAHCLY